MTTEGANLVKQVAHARALLETGAATGYGEAHDMAAALLHSQRLLLEQQERYRIAAENQKFLAERGMILQRMITGMPAALEALRQALTDWDGDGTADARTWVLNARDALAKIDGQS